MSRKRRHTRATFEDLVHPNFEELAHEYPDFAKAWVEVKQHQRVNGGSLASNVTQEFSIATTRALLQIYFHLRLPQIPTLCPPVPNRYFFVRWVKQHLLPLTEHPHYFELSSTRTGQDNNNNNNNNNTITTRFGIDLGTGATCIYPLLFCAPTVEIEDDNTTTSTATWKWLASEVNASSVQKAVENVGVNRLSSQIQVIQVAPTRTQQQRQQQQQQQQQQGNNKADNDDDKMIDDEDNNNNNNNLEDVDPSTTVFDTTNASGPILRLLEALPFESSRPMGGRMIDCILTNPPFHDPTSPTATQNHHHRSGDQRARTTLTDEEASYPGGEVAFLIDMLVDALKLMPHPSSSSWTKKSQQSNDNNNNNNSMMALWYASMVGKKTTLSKLIPILLHLLGPARTQSTQFGPGHLTRWFLAWTFCRPNIRSPLAICHHHHNNNSNINITTNVTNNPALLTFNVVLQEESDITKGILTEIVHRINTYFRTVPVYTLTLNADVGPNDNDNHKHPQRRLAYQELHPHVETWDANLLPPTVLSVLKSRNITFMDLLPVEGHFVLDIAIIAQSTKEATVQVWAFVHSKYGQMAVDKITSHMQAEVCRTSRKWRRFFQRQQQQQQQQPQQQQQQHQDATSDDAMVEDN